MTSKSMPWTTNNTGDGPTAGYATDRWQELLRTLSTFDPTLYYVIPNRGLEYAVSGTVTPVTVQSGEAWVNGRYANDDASQTVAIPTPTVATRKDRIILRSDGSLQTVRVVRLAGVEGSGVPPTLTQNSTTYEVSLAQVSITTGGAITVTDERGWTGVRGMVDATTLEWDTSGKKIRIKDLGVSTAKLADNAVTTAKILDANVTNAKLVDGAVTTNKITDFQVNAAKLATDAVTTVKILDGAVTNAKLVDGAVTTNKITDFQVNAAKLASDAVTTVKILDSAVTTAKIADGAVTNLKLVDGAITTNKISDSQVNAAKLASDAVTTIKILDGAVTNAKLFDGAITTNKITDFQVNAAKLASDAVTTVKILDGAVTTSKHADLSVTTIKLADNSVDDTKVGDRVPQFYRRQGGSATDWNVANTANYTPSGGIRMQAGVYQFSSVLTVTAGSGLVAATATITFPQSYSAKPLCMVSCTPVGGVGGSQIIGAYANAITTTTMGIFVFIYQGTSGTGTFIADIQWLAIGPE